MSAHKSADLARAATNTIKQIEGASKTPVKKRRTPKPEHGQQIFVFNHLQKNHMVYSLTRALKVSSAPYLFQSPGKSHANPRPRIMHLFPNSPSTAKKQSPPRSAKTSGTPLP
jgi:hypothetical protein